ncbi:transposase [Peterkaempfera bronchialis]|uniref:transposase n=1 Tax=Peterkaempfera bronchialis TaxID=2126346 RepID=UPI003C3092E5
MDVGLPEVQLYTAMRLSLGWTARRPSHRCRRAPGRAARRSVASAANLGEAAERTVARHRSCRRARAPQPEASLADPPLVEAAASQPWPTGHRFADCTRARHAAVHALPAADHSLRSIQSQLGMTYRTVKLLAEVTAPEDMFNGQWQNRPSLLDANKPSPDDRWNEGGINTSKPWEKIVPLGYNGSSHRLRAYPRQKRTWPQPATAPPSPGGSSAGPRRWPSLNSSNSGRSWPCAPNWTPSPGTSAPSRPCSPNAGGERLPEWLDAVRQVDLPSLHTLAAGMDRDRVADIAAFTLPWNSGAVEGHFNRIKMLRPRMFGHTGFELLRKRVLLAS